MTGGPAKNVERKIVSHTLQVNCPSPLTGRANPIIHDPPLSKKQEKRRKVVMVKCIDKHLYCFYCNPPGPSFEVESEGYKYE